MFLPPYASCRLITIISHNGQTLDLSAALSLQEIITIANSLTMLCLTLGRHLALSLCIDSTSLHRYSVLPFHLSHRNDSPSLNKFGL